MEPYKYAKRFIRNDRKNRYNKTRLTIYNSEKSYTCKGNINLGRTLKPSHAVKTFRGSIRTDNSDTENMNLWQNLKEDLYQQHGGNEHIIILTKRTSPL